VSFAYYSADLHLHTVLSACAELEMIPPLIMRRATQLGLQILAVTDHNSAENAAAMVEAGAEAGVVVLPGMEVQTREEVHLVCLFDTVDQAQSWQEHVYAHLPPRKNNDDLFGSQLVVDAQGEFVAFNERLLLTSTTLSIEAVFEGVERLGGLVTPAHVDRPAFSLLANLGFIPPGLNTPAVEVSMRTDIDDTRQRFPALQGVTLIQSSDAHRLNEMRNRLLFKIQRPAVAELRMAYLSQSGRKVIVG
jgi:3',5'-nucleoside bisphosphate phosphatase